MKANRNPLRPAGYRRSLSPKAWLLVCLCACILGIAAGLLYVLPRSEPVGNFMVMVFAVLTGILYTRYHKLRREERGKE